MKRIDQYWIVLVTAPNKKTARQLVRVALNERLAACANLIPRLESHYWWRGKKEKNTEILLLFKTKKAKLRALERCVLAQHPYATPEFIALPIQAGSQAYLAWIEESMRAEVQG